jgi:hypothetical protein
MPAGTGQKASEVEAASPTIGSLRRLTSSMLTRLPEPRQVAIGAGALILLLGAIGAVDLLAPSLPLSTFSLEGEHTLTAVFSAALLLGAGALAFQLASMSDVRSIGGPGLWRFMGTFLVFMALDELFAIHERVSAPVTGVSWQVVYAPIVVSAVVAWSLILRRLPSGSPRLLWLGGAAAWFVSQVIEAIQWDGERLVYEWTFVPEEMLEMVGSLLWGIALLVMLRRTSESGDVRDAEVEIHGDPVIRDLRLRQGRRRRVREADRAREGSRSTVGRTPGAP